MLSCPERHLFVQNARKRPFAPELNRRPLSVRALGLGYARKVVGCDRTVFDAYTVAPHVTLAGWFGIKIGVIKHFQLGRPSQ